MFKRKASRVLVLLALILFNHHMNGSRPCEVKVVDKDDMLLLFKDSEVKFVDDGIGNRANEPFNFDLDNEFTLDYGYTLHVTNLANSSNWLTKLPTDGNYGAAGKPIMTIYQKPKPNNMRRLRYNGGWVYAYINYST